MRALTATSFASFAAAAAMLVAAGTAEAACKKMGFLVNDYGKEGPTKDAQDLLDKHVAEWAAQNGIKNYTIGKKDVTCELYLNLILFDEHTCTASANVCWDEPGKEAPAKSAKTKDDAGKAEKAAAADKKSSAKPAEPAVEKVVEKTPEAAPAPAAIETGTLPAETAKPAAAPAAADDDAAARAAAAAERAAEAAERAAAAAEKAAAAAKATAPSQLEMPAFGAGKPAEVAPVTPVEPKS